MVVPEVEIVWVLPVLHVVVVSAATVERVRGEILELAELFQHIPDCVVY